MKEGWEMRKLLDICNVYQPTTISKKELKINGKYDVFGANGVIGKYDKYNHEESEVLLTCRGATCGNINISTPFSWINGNAMVVHPKTSELQKSFLVCQLSALDYKDIISGAAQPQITRQSLSKVSIAVPPLSEQQQIVSFLNSEFEKIDALKANAEKQLQAAKDLFQKALTEMLTPKDGWEEKTLDEISYDMFRGSGITREQIRNEGIACVRYGEIYTTYNYWFENCVSHTDEQIIKSPKYFEHGDILFAITGESVEDIGKSIAYLGNEKCMAGGDIVVMKHNENPKYLSYALATPDAVAQKGFGKTKLKVVHTSIPSLKTIVVPIPSLKEQQRIADHLDTLSAKVKQLEKNYNETITLCNDLKQSLLKRIFE